MAYELTRQYRDQTREHARQLRLTWREPDIGGVIRAHLTDDGTIMYDCPGCGVTHGVAVVPVARVPRLPVWDWNGSVERPTLSPSVLVNRHIDVVRCHHFIEDGMIRFLGDCDHALKHKTVELMGVSF